MKQMKIENKYTTSADSSAPIGLHRAPFKRNTMCCSGIAHAKKCPLLCLEGTAVQIHSIADAMECKANEKFSFAIAKPFPALELPSFANAKCRQTCGLPSFAHTIQSKALELPSVAYAMESKALAFPSRAHAMHRKANGTPRFAHALRGNANGITSIGDATQAIEDGIHSEEEKNAAVPYTRPLVIEFVVFRVYFDDTYCLLQSNQFRKDEITKIINSNIFSSSKSYRR
jgi:hypothetical protein